MKLDKRHILSTSILWVSAAFAIGAEFESIESISDAPDSVYRVQIAAVMDSREANEFKIRAESYGYLPVNIFYDTPYCRVKVGQLENYPDAHELKDDLLENAFIGAFVAREDNYDKLQAVSSPLTGRSNKLGISMLPSASSLDTAEPAVSMLNADLPTPEIINSRLDLTRLHKN